MFYFTNYYESEYKGRSIKSILNILLEMESKVKKYAESTPLSDIDPEDIERVTHDGEKIGLLCRASLEEREKQSPDYFKDSCNALCIKDLPVTFRCTEDSVIVSSPLMLKKGSSKVSAAHYQLSDYLKAAAIVWKRENPQIDPQTFSSLEGPLIAVITRRAQKYNRNVHCDNDNLEAGRLINTLCSLLEIGDNCTKLDLLCRFRECSLPSECGTEIVITSEKNTSKYV